MRIACAASGSDLDVDLAICAQFVVCAEYFRRHPMAILCAEIAIIMSIVRDSEYSVTRGWTGLLRMFSCRGYYHTAPVTFSSLTYHAQSYRLTSVLIARCLLHLRGAIDSLSWSSCEDSMLSIEFAPREGATHVSDVEAGEGYDSEEGDDDLPETQKLTLSPSVYGLSSSHC